MPRAAPRPGARELQDAPQADQGARAEFVTTVFEFLLGDLDAGAFQRVNQCGQSHLAGVVDGVERRRGGRGWNQLKRIENLLHLGGKNRGIGHAGGFRIE